MSASRGKVQPYLLALLTLTVNEPSRVRREDAYGQALAGKLSRQQRSELVKNLIKRAEMPRPERVARGKSRGYTNDLPAELNILAHELAGQYGPHAFYSHVADDEWTS